MGNLTLSYYTNHILYSVFTAIDMQHDMHCVFLFSKYLYTYPCPVHKISRLRVCGRLNFFFLYMFLANQRFIFVIFSYVAPNRGQPAAKCHPRWQPTRRLAVSCGQGKRHIWTRDCRTTVWHATIEPPCLSIDEKTLLQKLLSYCQNGFASSILSVRDGAEI
jgi:hypothetical protein